MSEPSPPPGEADLPPGTDLFGYVIDHPIGRGGMGTVYLAHQRSLGRQVAIKVLHQRRIRNRASVDDFLREARAAGKLNHPHLVLVHDVHVDVERGLYCYSMEYVPGTTASRLVANQGPLKRTQALHIAYQMAKALGHAHRSRLVHRDVKPDNILITANGVAKLLDLGLVRDQLEGYATANLSGSGSRRLMLVGTPDYSSPEQSRNPAQATPASDVYSLGATLFFLLTGRPPIAGSTLIDLIVRVATELVPYPEGIPADCRTLLDLLLAKDPSDRLPDGDAVAAALEQLAKGEAPTLPELMDDDGGDTVTDAEATAAVGEGSGSRSTQRRRRRWRMR